MQRSDVLPVLKVLSRIDTDYLVSGYVPFVLSADLKAHQQTVSLPTEIFFTKKQGLMDLVESILKSGETKEVDIARTYPVDDFQQSKDTDPLDEEDPGEYREFGFLNQRLHKGFDELIKEEYVISLKRTGRSESQPYYVARLLNSGITHAQLSTVAPANIYAHFLDNNGSLIFPDSTTEKEIKSGKFIIRNASLFDNNKAMAYLANCYKPREAKAPKREHGMPTDTESYFSRFS